MKNIILDSPADNRHIFGEPEFGGIYKTFWLFLIVEDLYLKKLIDATLSPLGI